MLLIGIIIYNLLNLIKLEHRTQMTKATLLLATILAMTGCTEDPEHHNNALKSYIQKKFIPEHIQQFNHIKQMGYKTIVLDQDQSSLSHTVGCIMGLDNKVYARAYSPEIQKDGKIEAFSCILRVTFIQKGQSWSLQSVYYNHEAYAISRYSLKDIKHIFSVQAETGLTRVIEKATGNHPPKTPSPSSKTDAKPTLTPLNKRP